MKLPCFRHEMVEFLLEQRNSRELLGTNSKEEEL